MERNGERSGDGLEREEWRGERSGAESGRECGEDERKGEGEEEEEKEGRWTEEQADLYLDAMEKERRYLQETW